MKTMTVCVSSLLVGLAICAAHDNPATAREHRRSLQRRCCPPVCAAVRPPAQSAEVVATTSPVPVEDAELRAKLVERRDTLRELTEILKDLPQHGRTSPSWSGPEFLLSGIQARIELIEAELPLANSHAERIALYEKSLESWAEIERFAQTREEAETGRREDTLRAKANRIKAEIDLHIARKMK